jgi:DNA replication protein DnaC
MRQYDDYFAQTRLWQKQQDAFGDSVALRHYRFDKDSGTVPQMAQARHYFAHWQDMLEQNMGLLFWGKPGSGKTFSIMNVAQSMMKALTTQQKQQTVSILNIAQHVTTFSLL